MSRKREPVLRHRMAKVLLGLHLRGSMRLDEIATWVGGTHASKLRVPIQSPIKLGWIEEVFEPPHASRSKYRKYRITPAGEKRLRAFLARQVEKHP